MKFLKRFLKGIVFLFLFIVIIAVVLFIFRNPIATAIIEKVAPRRSGQKWKLIMLI